MVLPAHTSQLDLNLTTALNVSCTWALGTRSGAFRGANAARHSATVLGLSVDPSVLSNVTVRCGGDTLLLVYRSLPDVSRAPFPRVGNLWGNLEGRFSADLAYAASHVDLWMGVSRWGAAEIGELRRHNRNTVVLGSVNAVEDQGAGQPGAVPERFYLHNASGCVRDACGTADRLETWPGSYRMDLTRPEVARWKARTMLELMLRGGGWEGHANPNTTAPNLAFDGLFVDNVFLSQWAMAEGGGLRGRPFTPQHWDNGSAWGSRVGFDAAWRAGVLLSLRLFRAAAPHALLSGHAMDPTDPGLAGIFNGISIGFDVPLMVEGERSVDECVGRARAWHTLPSVREPRVTMVESAPPLQIGYGYGFNAQTRANMPNATWDGLARGYYPNVRFGLAFSLATGSTFAHELGDSYHGQDWWYDELDHALGLPLGPAVELPACTGNATMCVEVGGAVEGAVEGGGGGGASTGRGAPALTQAQPRWDPQSVLLWVDPATGAAASLQWDAGQRAPGSSAAAAARVSVSAVGAAGVARSVDLHADGVTLTQGARYSLRFWARAEGGGGGGNGSVRVHVNARKAGGDWHGYGLDADVAVRADGAWAAHAANFTAVLGARNASAAAVSDARLSFQLGAQVAGVWIDRVELATLPPLAVVRQFECGLVALSADGGGGSVGAGVGVRRTLRLEPTAASAPALRRLRGTQAPLVQRIIDDLHPSFRVLSGAWAPAAVEGGYDANQPTAEQARGPYFHQWAHGLRACGGAGVAEWGLGVVAAGAYTVSAWWPGATWAAAQWSAAARFSIVRGAAIVAAATLDQRSRGDQFNAFAVGVHLEPGDVVRLECPSGPGACIADALLLESEARFNDGSDARKITLEPFDAIVLDNGKTCSKQLPYRV
eukprot:g1252.t1